MSFQKNVKKDSGQGGCSSALWGDTLFFSFHFLLFLVFSYCAFDHNSARLFIVADGPTIVSQAREQLQYFGISPDLHTNFLEGLGNISLAANLSVIPGEWFGMFDSAGNFTPAAAYTFYAAMLFVAVLLTGWGYRFSRVSCYVAAWLLAIIFMPYFRKLGIYPLMAYVPHMTLMLLIAAMLNLLVRRMGREGYGNTIFCALAVMMVIYMMLVSIPLLIILMLPFLFVTGFFSLKQEAPKAILRIVAIAIGIFCIGVALGWWEYFAGFILNTAYGFFHQEMQQAQPQQLSEASLLFQGDYAGRLLGPYVFMAAFLGASIALIKKETALKQPALIVLVAQALFAGIGGIVMLQPHIWPGPRPVYFETLFFPLYMLFAVYFLAFLLKRPVVACRIPGNPYIKNIMLAGPLALLALSLLLPAPDRDRRFYPYKNVGFNLGIPPASSVITDILEKEIGLHPGATFAGRVATVVPGEEFMPQYIYFIGVDRVSGNDYQMTGLWLKGIPTLHEYNQLITPGFYWFDREFLSAPGIPVMRNWSNFSKINLPIMKLLGVRFIITTVPGIEGAKQRAVFNVPFAEGEYPTKRTLYLFELEGVNTAGIPASKIVTVNSVEEAGRLMRSPSFDGSVAIMERQSRYNDLPGPLLPATESRLQTEKGGWHLHAKSAGATLLTLPIEYSHCMHMEILSGQLPKAMRVDVALTGVLFDREVDIKFVTRTGPFSDPRCRLRDYEDYKALMR